MMIVFYVTYAVTGLIILAIVWYVAVKTNIVAKCLGGGNGGANTRNVGGQVVGIQTFPVDPSSSTNQQGNWPDYPRTFQPVGNSSPYGYPDVVQFSSGATGVSTTGAGVYAIYPPGGQMMQMQQGVQMQMQPLPSPSPPPPPLYEELFRVEVEKPAGWVVPREVTEDVRAS